MIEANNDDSNNNGGDDDDGDDDNDDIRNDDNDNHDTDYDFTSLLFLDVTQSNMTNEKRDQLMKKFERKRDRNAKVSRFMRSLYTCLIYPVPQLLVSPII